MQKIWQDYFHSHGYPENFYMAKSTKLRYSFAHVVKLKVHHLTEIACYKFKNSFQYMNTPAYFCTVKIKAMYGLVFNTHNCNYMKMHNSKLSSIKLTISTQSQDNGCL